MMTFKQFIYILSILLAIYSPHVNVKLHMIRPKQVTRYSMSHKAFLVLLVSWQVFYCLFTLCFVKQGGQAGCMERKLFDDSNAVFGCSPEDK